MDFFTPLRTIRLLKMSLTNDFNDPVMPWKQTAQSRSHTGSRALEWTFSQAAGAQAGNRSSAKSSRCWPSVALLLTAFLTETWALQSAPVPVRFTEGAVHAFLVLRSTAGKILATGDFIQNVHGDRVMAHLVFHFKDGSLDDESSIFTQRDTFRLLSDRHIQKGPAFGHPVDMSIDVAKGEVTVRSSAAGRQKVEKVHLDLPDDLANGEILVVMKNIQFDVKQTTLSFLVPTPKPRLVHLLIRPGGKEGFSAAGAHYKAERFIAKVELGGVAGLLAPLVGEQPADTNVWIAEGEVPAFVKSQGPMFMGGPLWSIEMTSPVWTYELHEGH